jgi:hypothetical protein
VARLVVKNENQKEIFYVEIELCDQNKNTALGSNSDHNKENIFDCLKC